jgi:NADP-dependent 3-hydroxy acid dehydrogenase YdfG
MVSGKTIVLTGASSGIGAALARALGQQGNRLVLAARREAELRQVAEQSGEFAIPVVTDVRLREDVKKLRDFALAELGMVDVWINNAGRGIGIKVMDLTEEALDEMMAINLKSALYGMQAIIPHFQQRGQGHLINVSTHLSRVPFATYRSAYSAAKAGLNILTAQLRLDLRRDYPNIHISSVFPGMVDTEFHANALGGTPTRPPGVPVQTADDAASAIVALIENPVPELYTRPDGLETLQRYYHDVAGFEAGMFQPPRPPAS